MWGRRRSGEACGERADPRRFPGEEHPLNRSVAAAMSAGGTNCPPVGMAEPLDAPRAEPHGGLEPVPGPKPEARRGRGRDLTRAWRGRKPASPRRPGGRVSRAPVGAPARRLRVRVRVGPGPKRGREPRSVSSPRGLSSEWRASPKVRGCQGATSASQPGTRPELRMRRRGTSPGSAPPWTSRDRQKYWTSPRSPSSEFGRVAPGS